MKNKEVRTQAGDWKNEEWECESWGGENFVWWIWSCAHKWMILDETDVYRDRIIFATFDTLAECKSYVMSMLPIYEDLQLKAYEKQDADKAAKLRARAFALYTPPFRFRASFGKIWDSTGKVFSDDNAEDGVRFAQRIRGWGHISYEDEPEELQNEVGNLLCEALNSMWEAEKLKACK